MSGASRCPLLLAVTNGSDAAFTVVDIDECESVPTYEAELIFLRNGLGRSPY